MCKQDLDAHHNSRSSGWGSGAADPGGGDRKQGDFKLKTWTHERGKSHERESDGFSKFIRIIMLTSPG